ncbi:MAG: hypothetical protein GXX91_16845 [Verrucomicrobiaceae bacterium]|nr:hypothetical protein [Verrucomicrobiaceae bacterium]
MLSALTNVVATEKQIASLEEDIAELKAELKEVSSSGEAAAQLLSNIETAKAEMETTKAALPEKEKALAEKTYLLEIYQSAFRVVTSLVAGDDLGTVQLTTGEVLSGASFLKTEKGGILVQMATGPRAIPIEHLPATFSGKIQLPPDIAAPGTTLEALQAMKPAPLQTKEELAAAAAGTKKATASAPVASTAGAAAPAAAAATPADAYLEVQKRNTARQEKIRQIKARYAQLYAEKKKARADKASAEAGFRSAKIKKARTEVEATMKFHNSKIQRIEEEEASLRQEIQRIQSEFE